MRLKNLLKFAVGILLLALLLGLADWDALEAMLHQAQLFPAAMGMIMFTLVSALDMWRLRVASPAAQRMAWGAFIRLHMESYSVIQLLPGHMGFDLYRIAVIGKHNKGYAEPSLIIMGLRVFSLLSTLLFALILMLALPQWHSLYEHLPKRIIDLPAAIWLLSGLAIVVIGAASFWILWRLYRRYRTKLPAVRAAYGTLSWRRTLLLIALSLSMIPLRILIFIFSLEAFGIALDPWVAASIALCATLSWLLPISPAGIGVREGVTVGLLVWQGVAYAPALVAALLNRLYFMIFSLVGGLCFLLPRPVLP
ncbi:MAG: flippase-like domain-containing protein [Alphaproteobacteria bacterium]|nr:flippase-like domain-containing protein [Alphaproteobacteria bacterium]